MTIDEKYLVVGNDDGNIRFYDFQFKVAAWFENLNTAAIKSISFSGKTAEFASEEHEQDKDAFSCRDFIIADESAMVIQLKSKIFEAIESSKYKGETLMWGLKSSISAVAVHPKKSILAIAGSEGFIILFDYVKKVEISLNGVGYPVDKDYSTN